MSKNYLFSACVCCYESCDVENIKLGCVESGECLCLKSAACCAVGVDPYKCAFCANEDKEVASCDLLLCRYALKKPEVCFAQASQCLCIKAAGAFPFNDDYVKEPTCAICFISLLPEAGVLKQAPKSQAIDRFN